MPDNDSPRDVLTSPVRSAVTPAERSGPSEGIALCLSGGGYRAMLFHAGSLWRLNEAGLLGHVQRISSVSGGSIIAARLGVCWASLGFAGGRAAPDRFQSQVIQPIRDLASRTIDVRSVIVGAILPGVTISDRVAAAYDKYLFAGKTLADLPDPFGYLDPAKPAWKDTADLAAMPTRLAAIKIIAAGIAHQLGLRRLRRGSKGARRT
jgi:hypothetical protein